MWDLGSVSVLCGYSVGFVVLCRLSFSFAVRIFSVAKRREAMYITIRVKAATYNMPSITIV